MFFIYYDIDNLIKFYNIISKKYINLNINNYKELEKIIKTY